MRRKAPQFWLSEDQKLYKCFFSRPYLLYSHPEAVGFVEVIQETNLYLTRPLLRDIGGLICKGKHKNT